MASLSRRITQQPCSYLQFERDRLTFPKLPESVIPELREEYRFRVAAGRSTLMRAIVFTWQRTIVIATISAIRAPVAPLDLLKSLSARASAGISNS